jgi:hypothetical protein
MAEENRLLYMYKMLKQKESIQKTISDHNEGKGCKKTTEETMERLNIKPEEIKESSHQTKIMIKEKVNRKFEEDINEGGKDKHKVQHLKKGSEIQWKAIKRPEYMNKLTRLEVSTIFRARIQMLDIKTTSGECTQT